jgi:hypothetical protein
MLSPQAVKNIDSFFEKRAVEFGDVPRNNEQDRWPFWMPFIPNPPQDDELFPPTLTQSLTGLGWPIAPQGYRDIPIQTDQDAHYHIVNNKITCFRGAVTGEITAAANSTVVNGVGTLFTTEFQIGDVINVIDDNSEMRFGVVAAIGSNIQLVLHAPFGPNAVTGASATGLPASYRAGNQWYEQDALSGGIQVDAAGNITGINTIFTTELFVGMTLTYVDDNGNIVQGVIATITNNTTATFATAPGVVAGVAGVAFKQVILPKTAENNIRPLTTYLRHSIFIKSNNAVYLIGGAAELLGSQVFSPPSLGATAGGLIERPVSTNSVQGNRDGLSSLYTPFQMPKDGTLFVRVHNIHPVYNLKVNGTIFGYKVAV